MVAINAAVQLAALAGVITLQTLYAIIVARLLGVEDFGRYAFLFSIVQILLIGGDLGLHNTAIRKISPDLKHSPTFFPTFFYLKLVLSSLLFAVVVVLSLFVRDRLALVLFGLGMFLHCINFVFNVTFQAHGRLYLASINQFLVSLFNFGIGLGVLLQGGRLVGLAFAYLASVGLAALINWRTFEKRIHKVGLPRRREGAKFLKESLPVGAGTFLNTAAERIDVPLLTLLVGSYQTGIYAAAYRGYAVLNNIPLGFFSAVLPAMAASQDDRAGLRRLFTRSLALMILVSIPLAIALFVFAQPLIQFLYGEEYRASAGNLRLLAWGLVPLFVGMTFSHVMLSQGDLVRKLPGVAGAGLCVNMVANLILIPRIGSLGAAAATVITEIVRTLLYGLGVKKYLSQRITRIDTNTDE